MRSALIAAAGVAGLATWAGFQTMWPTSQVYGKTFIGLPRGSRLLALTYDDGPNDPYTPRLMEVLQRHSVKATFFLLGRFVQQKPKIARALVDAGHAIGIHSWDHPNFIFASQSEVRRQLQETQRVIFDATGCRTKLFRPPFGGRRPASLRVARRLGLEPVMWTVTCYDWKAKSAQEIVRNAERRIRGGDVILLHDGEYHRIGVDRSISIEASDRILARYSDRILARYKEENYRFITIPEMMAAREEQPGAASSK